VPITAAVNPAPVRAARRRCPPASGAVGQRDRFVVADDRPVDGEQQQLRLLGEGVHRLRGDPRLGGDHRHGVAAAIGVVLLMLGALGFHLRARFLGAALAPPAAIAVLAAVAATLRLVSA